jgi:hypothetical protein
VYQAISIPIQTVLPAPFPRARTQFEGYPLKALVGGGIRLPKPGLKAMKGGYLWNHPGQKEGRFTRLGRGEEQAAGGFTHPGGVAAPLRKTVFAPRAPL